LIRPRWRKIIADLWDNKVRTLLVVASIAVGVFAVGMIAGFYAIISQDLRDSYVAANPANIAIVTDAFDVDLPHAIERLDAVADAEGRRVVDLRVMLTDPSARSGGDRADALRLVAVPDLPLPTVKRLFPLQGSMDPGKGEVILERKTVQALDRTVGETIEIEMADGSRRDLTIVGIAQDVTGGVDAIVGDLTGFVSLGTLELVGADTRPNRLYVTVAESPNDKAHIESVAKQVTAWLEKSGRTAYSTSVRIRDESEVSSIIVALLGVLAMLGALSVVLSASLIANTMTSLLSQHLRQIGVMKLVGGRSRQVVGIYLTLMVALGGLALVVALPLAVWAANAVSAFVADLVNFRLSEYRVVPVAVILQVVIALGIPPLAGLVPVLGGSRVTVRKAIASAGLGGDKSDKKKRHRKGARPLRRMSRLVLVSVRNTFRHKGRLALTLLTLTLGGAVFISVFNTRVALNAKVDAVTEYFLADVNLTLSRPYRIEEIVDKVSSVPGVAEVEAWSSTGAEMLREDGLPPETVAVFAPPNDTHLVRATMLAGRWLVPQDHTALVINEAFWSDYPDLSPGDALRLRIAGKETDWTIVGVMQYTGGDDLIAYANYDYLAQELGQVNRSTEFRIITDEHSLAAQESIAQEVGDLLSTSGFRVHKVEAGLAFVTSITRMLGVLTGVLLMMALLMALVGSIGLTGTMSMNVLERTREIGVLRAIGAHDGVVLRLVIGEGLTIGAISFVLGTVSSFPITAALANLISKTIFNSPAGFSFSPLGVGIWLALVVLLSIVASTLPAWRASQMTIREILAYD